MKGLKNVAQVLGAGVVGLAVLLNLSGGSKNQKVEYRGVVTETHGVNNQGFTSEVLMFKMEPAFKQTVASKEVIIESTVLSSDGSGVVVKDKASGSSYRVNETKVKTKNPKVGETVKAYVIPKETKNILLLTSTPYEVGKTLTFRGYLEGASTVGHREIDGTTHPIQKLDVPINTVEMKKSIANTFIIISNGKAFKVSVCQGQYFLMPLDTHAKDTHDGLFKVNEKSEKLIPLSPGDISKAPCSIQDGYPYDSAAEVFRKNPFTPSKEGFNFLIGVFFTLLFLTIVLGLPFLSSYMEFRVTKEE